MLVTAQQDRVVQVIASISGHLRSGNRSIDRNSGSESFKTRKARSEPCADVAKAWYVKVSKTVATAAILKLLIGPDSSADHSKIISIQYKI